ncbi:MAG: A/G-specific adenine glycosylase [Flavobacteriales bacterium]|nr:A/G-specific adenine glycosylase [Flavobacteriales bacterium]
MSSLSWFSAALAPWYLANRRDLPWRRTRDPYRIWLSEVILQQTRVDQGLPYYLRFIARFPTVRSLAAAEEDQVLRLWQGLGYYSRARNLLVAAKQIEQAHAGKFPATFEELHGLRGIGDYTAAAIASIAFGEKEAVVDGNVYRVLARVFGIRTPVDSSAGAKEFRALANTLIPIEAPGDHNQAVMELGATVCLPREPRCPECPVSGKCIARREGRIAELPVKQGRTKIRIRHFNYLVLDRKGGTVLRKRVGKDIWQGLYEPPLHESDRALTRALLIKHLNTGFGSGVWKVLGAEGPTVHLLSHQRLHITFWKVAAPAGYRKPADWKWVSKSEMKALPLPRPVEGYFAQPL